LKLIESFHQVPILILIIIFYIIYSFFTWS